MSILHTPPKITRVITVWPIASPVAGFEWIITVPIGQLYRIRNLVALFTTDATVVSRQVALGIYNPAGQVIWWAPANVAQAASQAYDYAFVSPEDYPYAYFGGKASIPDMLLPAGTTIFSSTTNLQAADDWNLRACCIEVYNASFI